VDGICQCNEGTHDCGFDCMSLCSSRPDYFLDRIESCFLTDDRRCGYYAGWMGCYGDLQTSQGLVSGDCFGGTCPAM